MLVLDLAGDHTERAVGDVPGHGAAELACVEDPASSIHERDCRFSRRAEALIQMLAISIDLPHHMRHAAVERSGAMENDPDAVVLAPWPMPCRKAFGHVDRADDWPDRYPLLWLAALFPALVDDAAYRQPFDHAVGAALALKATGLHRLDFTVAHAGQIGAQDIRGGLKLSFLVRQRKSVEASPPWLAAIGINGYRCVHAA